MLVMVVLVEVGGGAMEEKAQKAKVQVRYTHNDGVIMYVFIF